jgi:4-carboxymuconolactone decarboxylase
MEGDRYERGWERLRELAGKQGERIIEELRDVAPDLARYVVEFGYGDVYSRPELDLRERQLVAISVLTALGGCEPQLEYHIGIALRGGVPREEIVETIIHCARRSSASRGTLNAARSRRCRSSRSPAAPASCCSPSISPTSAGALGTAAAGCFSTPAVDGAGAA